MKKYPKGLLFSALLLGFFPGSSDACMCTTAGPPCQAFWRVDAVFTGLVTEVEIVPLPGSSDNNPMVRGRLLVQESFRGAGGSIVEVFTPRYQTACGFPFRKGEQYLVYANRRPDTDMLTTSNCTRTRSLAKATEDLLYLRGLASVPSGSRIFGRVGRYTHDLKTLTQDWSGFVGIPIAIEGSEAKVEIVTGMDGRFDVHGLPPGRYRVTPRLPPKFSQPARTIDVADKGCAEIIFWTQVDGRISGRIFDADGRPVPHLRVTLIPEGIDLLKETNKREWASTDDNGWYSFKELPPGRYQLGINLIVVPDESNAFPRTYHPGVKDRRLASVINLTKGERLEGYDFFLPPRLTWRQIGIAVTWPDGSPAQNAVVQLQSPDYANPPSTFGSGKTDTRGLATLKFLGGIPYSAWAQIRDSSGTWVCAPHKDLPTGSERILKLVLDRPLEECFTEEGRRLWRELQKRKKARRLPD